jgi:hypothetical protein
MAGWGEAGGGAGIIYEPTSLRAGGTVEVCIAAGAGDRASGMVQCGERSPEQLTSQAAAWLQKRGRPGFVEWWPRRHGGTV